VPGPGALATKANLQEFHDILVTARDRVRRLFDEGKSEQEVLAVNPLADLDKKWAAAQGLGTGTTFLRDVYNSFRNHD
jgi:cyclase